MSARLFPAGLPLLLALLAAVPGTARSQEIRDIRFTAGTALEGYSGNLATLTVPVVDSAEYVGGVVGQLSGTGDFRLLSRPGKALDLFVDGGVRQYATWGWQGRDFAPREAVLLGDLSYRQTQGWGSFSLGARGRGRWVRDRAPVPLYVEPGYEQFLASAGIYLNPVRDVRFDAQILGEVADYAVEPATPQLDLLDRESVDLEIGAAWGEDWTVRAFTGLQYYRYPNQGSFDPDDPVRRDRALRGGMEWTSGGNSYFAQVGVEGIFNRSNSSRPEYNAYSFRGLFASTLPWDIQFNAYAQITDKNYLKPGDFVLLVPGEEADNASVIFVQGTRALNPQLDGSLRIGWTRAESNIADEYFERFGATFILTYRPRWGR